MSFEVRGRCETPSYFFIDVASFFLSACCASGDLSALSGGGVSLCDNDAKSRYRQVNKFPRQYRLFTSDLRSYATTLSAWSALGFCRR